MTYRELVREYMPNVTDEEADFVLWELTPFPIVMGAEDLHPYLVEVALSAQAVNFSQDEKLPLNNLQADNRGDGE